MTKFYLFAVLLSLGMFVGCGGEVKPPAEDGAADAEEVADGEEMADGEEAADAETADGEEAPVADGEEAPAADAEPAPPIEEETKVETPEVEVTPPAEPAE